MAMDSFYDAIVVGARCAGAPTAMLLARKGHRVLLVDRATFPSDTLSTHVVQPLGVAALARWGLLDRLIATGCPAIDTYLLDFGPVRISGAPGTAQHPVSYCPRRTVLDKLLVDAAAEAGVEVRQGFSVDRIVMEGDRVLGISGRTRDGASSEARAHVVIGADGRNSVVAQAVAAELYNERPPLLAAYYAYWSGLPMHGRFETYIRPRRGFAAAETHDGLTMIVAGWPIAEFEQNKADVEGNWLKTIALAPAFAKRLQHAKRETRFLGATLPNFFRKPFGPGWTLVGDAAYHKDAITAQGITDAFREAERCADGLDRFFSGVGRFDDVMADYQRGRDDRVRPMYEFTCQLAALAPPPPDMQRHIGAIAGDQPAMDAFVRMNAGTMSPAEYFTAAERRQA
jgi:2-polyprenyl-6-methoxyphenol hydroxylase-like FAD-dependent oxidoreductase